jgi:hypothetical protein
VAGADFDEWKVMFVEAAANISFVCRTLENRGSGASLPSQIPVAWPNKFNGLAQRPSLRA